VAPSQSAPIASGASSSESADAAVPCNDAYNASTATEATVGDAAVESSPVPAIESTEPPSTQKDDAPTTGAADIRCQVIASIDSPTDYVGQDHIIQVFGFASTTKADDISSFLNRQRDLVESPNTATGNAGACLLLRMRWLNDNAVVVITNSISFGMQWQRVSDVGDQVYVRTLGD
jgi:hypothetical protein